MVMGGSIGVTIVLTVLSTLTLLIQAYQEDPPQEGSKCQRITVPLCSDVAYNYTRLPNMLGHSDQERVQVDVQHFEPLIHTSCSAHVRFFVCSIYTPMCTDTVDYPITSCRSVCEEVKRSCLKILTNFGLSWPEALNCSKFPKKPELCMEPTENQKKDHDWSGGGEYPPDHPPYPPSYVARCPADMMDLDPTDPHSPCTLKCGKNLMFEKEHKQFAELWMVIWSSICLVVTAFTVITCLLDTNRFRFPEKSIIYLAACYHFYSWAYVVRLIIKSENVACRKLRDGQSYLISGDLDNPTCVLTFMALYYFSMASNLWWVVLTFTWYLSAGKKWCAEAIEAWSSYFHFIAWGIPALLSIAVLITHKVDASELTGLCYVGQNDPTALGGFVIGPLLLFVVVGCAFILAGFGALCSVRKTLRTQGTKDIGKLEKLMVKIGIFSVLYVVPAVVVIACDAYHAYVLLQWQPHTTRCKLHINSQNAACKRPDWKPQVELYMLNIFMSLIVGITCGMWVASRKTCLSWQRFLCCGHFRGPDTKLAPYCTTVNGPAAMPLMNRYSKPMTVQQTAGGYHMSPLQNPAGVNAQNSGSSYTTSASRKYPSGTAGHLASQRYFQGSSMSDASKV